MHYLKVSNDNYKMSLPEIIIQSLTGAGITPQAQQLFTTYLQQSGVDTTNIWKPHHDIIETPKTILIYLDIPGVDKETLKVDFFNNVLEIEGSRMTKYNPDLETTIVHSKQIIYGNFTKSITMPISVTNKQSVKVIADSGVLTVSIDKESENSNRFSVKVQDEES